MRPFPSELPDDLEECLKGVVDAVGDDGTATVTETKALRSLRKAGAFEEWVEYIGGLDGPLVRVSLTYEAERHFDARPSRPIRKALGDGAEIAGRFVGGYMDAMGD